MRTGTPTEVVKMLIYYMYNIHDVAGHYMQCQGKHFFE